MEINNNWSEFLFLAKHSSYSTHVEKNVTSLMHLSFPLALVVFLLNEDTWNQFEV